MVYHSNTTNYFEYKPESKQNPDTGFLSYQHFRGEKLYSDCVTDSKNNMTETENFECYPVPEGVEENGRSQGYFPDTSAAYIRFLWKEFEPQKGEYNYEFVENIINKARAAGQSLILRIMPHSTCERDDVPRWLKKLIPCPERPDGMRVKDSPTDPLFIKLFSDAIKALGERFDSSPVLDSIDICLPGAWGEGHNLHLYSRESIDELYQAYALAFKNTRLICQLLSPELIQSLAKSNKVGIRADGFGEANHINNLYPPCIEKISDLWKICPISFESYWWIGEWYRKGWDIDKLINLSLDWHISTFNAKSMPVPMEWKDKIDYWVSKMGYHFSPVYFSYPSKAARGSSIEAELCVDNIGSAPMYNDAVLYIELSGEDVFRQEAKLDLKKWLPGKTTEKLSLTLPGHLKPGEYKIKIAIFKTDNTPVYLATDAESDDNYYTLGKMNIF